MKILKLFILFTLLFVLTGCSKLDLASLDSERWNVISENTGELETFISVEDAVEYDEMEFEYEINGSYTSYAFYDNVSDSKVTKTDNAINIKLSEMEEADESEDLKSSLLIMRIVVKSFDIEKGFDIKLSNIKLHNSKTGKTYKLNDCSRHFSYVQRNEY